MSPSLRIPSSRRILKNCSLPNGFVNMSASWLCVSTNVTSTSPLSMWSRRKRCRISMCFVLECMTGFFVMLMALVLSHRRGMQPRFTPKSRSCCLSHKICAQQLPAVMYSASVVLSATHACFLHAHDTSAFPRM